MPKKYRIEICIQKCYSTITEQICIFRENRNRDLYTLQTLQNHPEFKKKTITRPVVFITHGFTSSASETNFINLAKALVDKVRFYNVKI